MIFRKLRPSAVFYGLVGFYSALGLGALFIEPWAFGEYINIGATTAFVAVMVAWGVMGFRALFEGYQRWHLISLGLFFTGLGIVNTRGIYSQALRVLKWEWLRDTHYPPFVFATIMIGGILLMASIIKTGNNEVPPRALKTALWSGGIAFVGLVAMSLYY